MSLSIHTRMESPFNLADLISPATSPGRYGEEVPGPNSMWGAAAFTDGHGHLRCPPATRSWSSSSGLAERGRRGGGDRVPLRRDPRAQLWGSSGSRGEGRARGPRRSACRRDGGLSLVRRSPRRRLARLHQAPDVDVRAPWPSRAGACVPLAMAVASCPCIFLTGFGKSEGVSIRRFERSPKG